VFRARDPHRGDAQHYGHYLAGETWGPPPSPRYGVTTQSANGYSPRAGFVARRGEDLQSAAAPVRNGHRLPVPEYLIPDAAQARLRRIR
jgi:hypothetical protein